MSLIEPVTINRWAALLKAATPGPWGRDTTDPGGPRHTENVVANSWDVAICGGADVAPEQGRAAQAAADADIIAESPAIIAALLAERLELLDALADRACPPPAPKKPGFQVAKCAAGHLTYAEPNAPQVPTCRCGSPLGEGRAADLRSHNNIATAPKTAVSDDLKTLRADQKSNWQPTSEVVPSLKE